MKKTINRLLACSTLLMGVMAAQAQGLEGIIVEEFHTITQADADVINDDIAGSSYAITPGTKVYRVYVDMAPNYRLASVFGSPIPLGGTESPNPLSIRTTTTFWNDDNFGSEMPGQTRRIDEGTAFDSYITVSTTGFSGGAAGCGTNTQQLGIRRQLDTDGDNTTCGVYPGFTGNDGSIPGTVPSLTYNLSASVDFSALTENGSVLSMVNDGWSTLPNQMGIDPTGSNVLLVGQFTTNGEFTFKINVALADLSNNVETYVHTTAAWGEVVSPFLTYPAAACNAPVISSITSNGPLCAGSTLQLNVTAMGDGPLTYAWTGPNLFTSIEQNPSISTNAVSGTYSVTVSNGCAPDATATVEVVVNQPANAGTNGTLAICAGSTVSSAQLFAQLGGTPTAGGTWSPALAGAGVYTYTVTGNAPCANATATVTVTEQAQPNAGSNGTLSICSMAAAQSLFAQLSGAPANGGTWNGPSTVIDGNYDPSSMTPGVYTYTVAATAPCTGNATATVTVTETATGTWYQDADGDGSGDPNVVLEQCDQPAGYVANNNDLCPADAGKIVPGACGCGIADVAATYYADQDGDGLGDPATPIEGFTCSVPAGAVTNSTDDCPTTPGRIGDTCNDNNPNTSNDVIGSNCVCAGTLLNEDCEGVPGGSALPGSPCDDGDASTGNDVYGSDCVCAGLPLDCLGIPGGTAVTGSSCNDNNPLTENDVYQSNCQCAGTPITGCTEIVNIAITTDASPAHTSWEIIPQGGGAALCTGAGSYTPNSTTNETCCLPIGCYSLRVLDSAGDGIAAGGYVLSELTSGKRIIDNTGNFTTGSLSAIAATYDNGAFCVPVGDDKLIHSSCDKLDWVANKFIVVAENVAVSAQYGVTNATSGYEFWFFDPNGSYSFRRFRSHATSDGYGTGALRANHFKINGWINSVATPHLPANKVLNVRIRGRVAGINLPFGPACLFKLDAALAACPRVKLQDDAAFAAEYSCGVTRTFGGGNTTANRITATPPQPIPTVASANVRYQFRFRIPGESICIVRPPQTSARIQLNWNSASGAPLVCNKTYDVDVRVSLDGGATWCFGPASNSAASACSDNEAWGKVCKVTIAACAQATSSNSSMVTAATSSLTMYPNPNRGDQLFVTMNGLRSDITTVAMDILDMTGKRVAARTIIAQDGYVNQAIVLNGDLAAGLYLVHFTAGDQVFSERLVVQH